MPRLDQTGPNGAGPMSGRAAGSCNSKGATSAGGCGMGGGRGRGRGAGYGMRANNPAATESSEVIDSIHKRLDALEGA